MDTDVATVRRALERGGWVGAAQVAGLMFLVLLAAGAVLLLAGKLQFSSLGAGAGPVSVLRAIGLLALACLGVAIDIGGLTLSTIPLGVLAILGLATARFVREVFARDATYLDALKVGAVFGAICALGAAVFRFGGDVPVDASILEALALGFVWGTLLAGYAVVRVAARTEPLPLPVHIGPGPVRDGLRLSLRLAPPAVYGAAVALLLLIIGRLIAGPLARTFGVGDAVAALLYLVAFLPNALLAVLSLAYGATLRVGAQVGVGGELVGPLRERSLFGWGAGDPPVAIVLLVVLPIVVSALAGVWSARRHDEPAAVATRLAVAALVLGFVVAVLAGLADARLGAGLLREQGIGLVAVDAGEAALLVTLWTFVGGAVAAFIDRRMRAAR